jgi:hypothetical protein
LRWKNDTKNPKPLIGEFPEIFVGNLEKKLQLGNPRRPQRGDMATEKDF